ncbi:unnamed protein product [Rotaria sp. Silwood1]|nr:unnamed protein product [Rotaria sp. Silwood1]
MLCRIFHRYTSTSAVSRSKSFTYPQRINRSPTAILESLNACVQTDGGNPTYLYMDDPFLIPTSAHEKRQLALSKASGKKAARWIMDRYSYAFFNDVAVPSIPSYFPNYIFDEKEFIEPDETTLYKLMNWNKITKAYEIYKKCLDYKINISDACKYALFDLLCIYNSDNPIEILPPEEDWYRRELNETNQSDCPYIDECIYPCPIEPHKLLDALDWMDKEMVAIATPKLIGSKPNAFSFSHWLAETILSEEQKNLPSISIVRVSIIGASWKEPYPGWVEKSNGPSEFFVAAGRGYLRSMKGDSHDVLDIVPVDIPVNLSITAAWQKYSEDKNDHITIYHCTSSGLNPFRWQEMSNYFTEYSKRVPYEHAFRRPNLSVTSHSLIHDSYIFFSHLIPAYLADIGLCLIGRKPHIVNIYKNLHRTLLKLESFTIREEIQCSYDSLNSLRQLIIETNNLNEFYFDIRALHWPTYIESYLIGTKRYILNEDIHCLNGAQKHLNNLRNIRWTFNTIILILLWRIFISKRPTARNLWYFIINFFVAKFVRFFKILSAGNA